MSNVNENDFIDEEDKAEFHALAENLGLTERQEAGVWGWIEDGVREFVEELDNASETYVQDAEADLHRLFGRDFERKQKGAAALVRKYGGDGFVEFLNETGLCNCREIVAFLMRLADAAGEDRGLVGEKSAVVPSAERLKAEIAGLTANPAYMQAQHPDHAKTVQAVYALRKRLFNED